MDGKMKKNLMIFLIVFMFVISTGAAVFAANSYWANPKSIRTYIEPNSKKELMKQAFAKWSIVTHDKIVFKYVSNPENAQIKVKFVKDASMKGLEQAIGVTHSQRNLATGELVFAQIDIADHVPGAAGKLMPKDRIYRAMIHEIGHAIGLLEHSTDRASIMYPAAISRNQAITQGDLNDLAKAYKWK